jgi:hypothetical protein
MATESHTIGIRLVVASLALLLGLGLPAAARAQPDPRPVLTQMIMQLQTGTPNPTWYGLELWQTMAAQTGGTGVYLALVQLGAVTSVTVNQQTPLPAGALYSMTATHQNGTSTWTLGISALTRRIEYANFLVNAAPQALPSPAPSTPTPPVREPRLSPPPNPSPGPVAGPRKPAPADASPACQRFPNLC